MQDTFSLTNWKPPCLMPRFLLGKDDKSTVRVMMAVLHYIIPLDKPAPTVGHVYLIGGRIASVTDKTFTVSHKYILSLHQHMWVGQSNVSTSLSDLLTLPHSTVHKSWLLIKLYLISIAKFLPMDNFTLLYHESESERTPAYYYRTKIMITVQLTWYTKISI
jgi:hypothetical protein